MLSRKKREIILKNLTGCQSDLSGRKRPLFLYVFWCGKVESRGQHLDVPYEVSLRAADDRPCLRSYMCIILDSMKKICRGDHRSPVERDNRKNSEATPQSTALTAPLKGSHVEYVVCRKPLLEEMGPLAVEWRHGVM